MYALFSGSIGKYTNVLCAYIYIYIYVYVVCRLWCKENYDKHLKKRSKVASKNIKFVLCIYIYIYIYIYIVCVCVFVL